MRGALLVVHEIRLVGDYALLRQHVVHLLNSMVVDVIAKRVVRSNVYVIIRSKVGDIVNLGSDLSPKFSMCTCI